MILVTIILPREHKYSVGKSRPHNNLAVALIHAGRAEEAIEQLQIAVSINPRNVDALFNLAQLHQMRGDDILAIIYYNRAVRYGSAGSPAPMTQQGKAEIQKRLGELNGRAK